MKSSYLGEFEQLVLVALLRLGDNAYGMKVLLELREIAGRSTSLGAVYTTLERLEEKGFVSSYMGDSTPERGGKAKRYFKINGTGMTALTGALAAMDLMRKGLKPILG